MKRIILDAPKILYALCVLLAMAYWMIFLSTDMGDLAKNLFILFLPLVSTPYILWIVHSDRREPEERLKERYGGTYGMWFIRIFMIVVISVLSLVAAIMVLGVPALIIRLF